MRVGTVLTVASAAAVTAVVMAHWKRVHYWPVSATVLGRWEPSWPAELSVRLLVAGLLILVFACGALLVAKHWPEAAARIPRAEGR